MFVIHVLYESLFMLKEAMQVGYGGASCVENGFTNSNSSNYVQLQQFQRSNGTCFSFQKRFERVDWKKLAALDINKICHELDIQSLQDNISNVTFCNIESEVDGSIDPNFTKLFKLAQLIIEYLLHSQEYLTGVIETLEERLHESNHELVLLKKERTKEQHRLTDLQKENKRNKKMLVKQQHLFSGLVGNGNRCPFCPKAFVNASFLKCHLSRRHPQQVTQPGVANNLETSNNEVVSSSDQNIIEALKDELQELKGMLKNSKHSGNSKEEKNILERERSEKIERMRQEIQMWKEESERHKQELDNAQKAFFQELKELHEKQQNYDKALSDLKQTYSEPQKTNFGPLLDEGCDENVNVKLLSQQKEEINNLKMQLKSQIAAVENLLQDELLKKEKEWTAKVKDLKEQHTAELEKVLLQQTPIKGHSKLPSQEGLERVSLKKTSPKQNPSRLPFQDDKQDVHFIIPYQDGKQEARTHSILRKMPQIVNGEWKKSSRLISALTYTPDLLTGLQKELCGLVEDKMQKFGIKPFVSSVSNEQIGEKLDQLNIERTSLAERYETFYELRQCYANTVDKLAKNKLKLMQNKSFEVTSSPSKVNHTVNAINRSGTASPEAGDLGGENFLPKPLPRRVNFKNEMLHSSSRNDNHLGMGEPEVLRVKPFDSDTSTTNQLYQEKQVAEQLVKTPLPGSIRVLPQVPPYPKPVLKNTEDERFAKGRRDSENKLSSVSTSVWDTESCKPNDHSDSAESTGEKNSLASVSSWDSEEDLNVEEIH